MSGKFTYKIVEKSKEDPIFSMIEKGNVTVRFTVQDIRNNLLENQKMVKSLKGKLQIEEARKENIERNHPFVKDLTPEQCFTVHMYEEANSVCRSFPEKVKEFEESIVELEQELKNIEEEVGIVVPKETVAPEKSKEESRAINL